MVHFFDKTNLELQQDVMNALRQDSRVESKAITVKVQDGIVTLLGSVPSYFQKSAVDEIAQKVRGVRALVDELNVSLPTQKSDQELAREVLDVFAWTLSIPADTNIKVEKGWVTLSGKAEWDFQKTTARNAVSQIEGVCGVTNHIQTT